MHMVSKNRAGWVERRIFESKYSSTKGPEPKGKEGQGTG